MEEEHNSRLDPHEGGQSESHLRFGLIGTVNLYIKEYLEKSHFDRSQEAFVQECTDLQIPIREEVPESGNERPEEVISERTIEELIEMFDNTYEDAFFTIWDDHATIPHVHDTSSYMKINFRLHIYFCCRKISENLAPMGESLQNVRDFFDREGTALSNEQEFIHYFALPFVTNPQDHPTFKGLFEYNNWMRLRNDLGTYLNEIRLSEQFSSRLVKLVMMNSVGSGKEIYQQFVLREKDALKLRKKYSVLVANHQQLRKDYQKLVAITKELTSGLEMVARMSSSPASRVQSASTIVNANMIQWDKILGNCSRIYPELFPPQTPGKSIRRIPKVNEEILQNPMWQSSAHLAISPPMDHKTLTSAASTTSTSSIQVSFVIKEVILKDKLNFRKIKTELAAKEPRKDTLTLWQALRWLLTQSVNGERSSVLQSYLKCDLLDSQASSDLSEVILNNLDPNQEEMGPILCSCTSRMLNAIASLKCGRDYLALCDMFVDKIIQGLVSSEGKSQDSILMMVATLQKLSLKCMIRKKMIDQGMVEWLVIYMENSQELSVYALEYSTALFMNLCLHKSGKDRCLPKIPLVLKVLQSLLSLNLKQIFPYVNGTLFSLLSHPQIASQAQASDLQRHLEKVHQSVDEETKRQLEHILEQLGQEIPTDQGSPSNEGSSFDDSTSTISEVDDDESLDGDIEIEDEIDANDPVIHDESDTFGMEYLIQNFTLSEKSLILETDQRSTSNTSTIIREISKESQPDSPKKQRQSRRNSSISIRTTLIDPDSERKASPPPAKEEPPVEQPSPSSDDGVIMVTQNPEARPATHRPRGSGAKTNPAHVAKESVPKTRRHPGLQKRRGSHSVTKEKVHQPESLERSKSQPLNPAVPLPPVPNHPPREDSPGSAEKAEKKTGNQKRTKPPKDPDEIVTSKNMTVLPPLANATDKEGGEVVSARPSSKVGGSAPAFDSSRLKSSSGEKRTISMTFPYSPLSQIEGYLVSSPPSPRKRWKKLPLSVSKQELTFLSSTISSGPSDTPTATPTSTIFRTQNINIL